MNRLNRKVASNFFMFFLFAIAVTACSQNPSASNDTGGTVSSDTGIIGGVEVTDSEANLVPINLTTKRPANLAFAKKVALLFNRKTSALCTSSIYSDSILVTAAHCVEGNPANLIVVFGTDLKSPNIKVRAVDDFRVSPIWPQRQNFALNTGDIAVVKFSGGLPTGFSPALLLTDSSLMSDNMPILLAGFGASTVVPHVDPKTGAVIVNRQTGNPVYDHQGAGKLRYVTTSIVKANYTKTEILVENSNGRGACHGDSGGPAYIEINGQQVLVGVTSRSTNDPNNRCNGQSIYTNIAFYSHWISGMANLYESM